MKLKGFFFGTLLVLTNLACEQEDIVDPINSPALDDVDSEVLYQPMQTFNWNILNASLCNSPEAAEDNVMISPLSISTALYMAYNAADGETKTAMEQTLALNGISSDSLNAAYKSLIQLLTNTRDGVQLKSNNAVFWDKNRIIPSDSFIEQLTSMYEAGTFEEDFQRNPDEVVEKINAWVDEKTEGRIEKILDQLKPEEVLFLVNALYLLGDWDQPFAEESTEDRPFTLSSGAEIMTPTMYDDNQYQYLQNEDYSIVQCDLADTTYAMWFVLPPEGKTVESLTQEHSFEDILLSFSSESVFQRIFLLLPKLELNYKIQLNDILKSMGMEVAFDPNRANFSKFGQAGGNIFISRVEHKTFFKMDEKGVEGAAVTSVGFGVTSAPPAIQFNRPFFDIINS